MQSMADPPLKSQESEALEAAVRCVCARVWPPQRSDLDALKCELATFIVCYGTPCDDGRRRINAAMAGSYLTNYWKRYAAGRPGLCPAKWGKLKQLTTGESRFDLDSPPGRPSNLEVFLDCRDIYALASAEGWLDGALPSTSTGTFGSYNGGSSSSSSHDAGTTSSTLGPAGSSSSSAAPLDAAAALLGGLSLGLDEGGSLVDDGPPGIGPVPAGNGARPGSLAPFGPLAAALAAPPIPHWDPLPPWDPSNAEAILSTRMLQLQKVLLDARSQALEANRVAQSAQESLTRVLAQLGVVQAQLAAAQEQIAALRRWPQDGPHGN